MTNTKRMQEVYDIMVGGVLRQGKPGKYKAQNMTITPDGCRCTAGFLVQDPNLPRDLPFRIGLNGADFLAWSLDLAFDAGGIPQDGGQLHALAIELVSVHDSSSGRAATDEDFIFRFRAAASDVATRFGLSAAILDQTA